MAYSWLEGSISQLTETISSSIPPDLSEKISSTLSDVPDSVQSARTKIASSLPPDAHDLLEKLTLSSPELTAERDRIDIEERRKESVRNCLAELLPWETRDEERAILVDECREAILALSAEEGTFAWPHGGGENGGDGGGPGDGEEATTKDGEVATTVKDGEGGTKGAGKEPLELLDDAIRARKRADAEGESPHPQNEDDREGGLLVPPLLASFDLDAHVGLIDRVLDEDDELVRMHAALSGSTVKEVNFWRNYFHHCALTRLKIGLDLDEIWGGAPPPTEEELIRAGAGAGGVPPSSSSLGGADTSSVGSARDETITFDTSSQTGAAGSTDGRSRTSSASSAAMAAAAGGASSSLAFNASSMESYTPFAASPDAASGVKPATDGTDGGHGTPSSKASSPASEFELVNGPSASNEADLLDDLDAEIARELES